MTFGFDFQVTSNLMNEHVIHITQLYHKIVEM